MKHPSIIFFLLAVIFSQKVHALGPLELSCHSQDDLWPFTFQINSKGKGSGFYGEETNQYYLECKRLNKRGSKFECLNLTEHAYFGTLVFSKALIYERSKLTDFVDLELTGLVNYDPATTRNYQCRVTLP